MLIIFYSCDLLWSQPPSCLHFLLRQSSFSLVNAIVSDPGVSTHCCGTEHLSRHSAPRAGYGKMLRILGIWDAPYFHILGYSIWRPIFPNIWRYPIFGPKDSLIIEESRWVSFTTYHPCRSYEAMTLPPETEIQTAFSACQAAGGKVCDSRFECLSYSVWFVASSSHQNSQKCPGQQETSKRLGFYSQSYAKAPQLGQGSAPDWRKSRKLQPLGRLHFSLPRGVQLGLFMGITMVYVTMVPWWLPPWVGIQPCNPLPANDWSRYVDIPRP